MAKQKSRFGRLNARELLHGFLLAAVTAILAALYKATDAKAGFDMMLIDWPSMASTGLGAGILFLLQRLTRNSKGQSFKREPKEPKKNPYAVPLTPYAPGGDPGVDSMSNKNPASNDSKTDG